MNEKYWQRCPKCGSHNVENNIPVCLFGGAAMLLLGLLMFFFIPTFAWFLIFYGLFLLVMAFNPYNLKCQDCGKNWFRK
jgi:hypothetical protein